MNTKEERIDIGRRLYTHELDFDEAKSIYWVGDAALRNYVREYKASVGLDETSDVAPSGYTQLNELSKEQLIELIMKKDIENERLKKGYLVKGVGSKKEFVTIKDVNTK